MAIAAEAISKAVPKALAVGLGGRALLRQVCADFAIAVADQRVQRLEGLIHIARSDQRVPNPILHLHEAPFPERQSKHRSGL